MRMLSGLTLSLLFTSLTYSANIYYPGGGYPNFYVALDEAAVWSTIEETTLHITSSSPIDLDVPYVLSDLDFKLVIAGDASLHGALDVGVPEGQTGFTVLNCEQVEFRYIDVTGGKRFLRVENSSVDIDVVNLTQFQITHSSALSFSSSSVEIRSCDFTDCQASGNGNGLIQANHTELVVEDCLFEDNEFIGQHGCITQAHDWIEIRNTEFTGNRILRAAGTPQQGLSETGGCALATSECTATVLNCEFEDNKVERVPEEGTVLALTGVGGAIHIKNGSNLTVSNSHFTLNQAEKGGAIGSRTSGYSDVSVIGGTTFSLNESNAGGAISISLSELHVVGDEINPVIFASNRAHGPGGAIYSTSGECTVDYAEFNSNSAYSGGGAIYVMRMDIVDPPYQSFIHSSNSVYNTNSISVHSASSCVGGAICCIWSGCRTVSDEFLWNTAVGSSDQNWIVGGAIGLMGSSLYSEKCSLVSNSINSGGADGAAAMYTYIRGGGAIASTPYFGVSVTWDYGKDGDVYPFYVLDERPTQAIIISDAYVVDNFATVHSTSTFGGSALYSRNPVEVDISKSTFRSNDLHVVGEERNALFAQGSCVSLVRGEQSTDGFRISDCLIADNMYISDLQGVSGSDSGLDVSGTGSPPFAVPHQIAHVENCTILDNALVFEGNRFIDNFRCQSCTDFVINNTVVTGAVPGNVIMDEETNYSLDPYTNSVLVSDSYTGESTDYRLRFNSALYDAGAFQDANIEHLDSDLTRPNIGWMPSFEKLELADAMSQLQGGILPEGLYEVSTNGSFELNGIEDGTTILLAENVQAVIDPINEDLAIGNVSRARTAIVGRKNHQVELANRISFGKSNLSLDGVLFNHLAEEGAVFENATVRIDADHVQLYNCLNDGFHFDQCVFELEGFERSVGAQVFAPDLGIGVVSAFSSDVLIRDCEFGPVIDNGNWDWVVKIHGNMPKSWALVEECSFDGESTEEYAPVRVDKAVVEFKKNTFSEVQHGAIKQYHATSLMTKGAKNQFFGAVAGATSSLIHAESGEVDLYCGYNDFIRPPLWGLDLLFVEHVQASSPQATDWILNYWGWNCDLNTSYTSSELELYIPSWISLDDNEMLDFCDTPFANSCDVPPLPSGQLLLSGTSAEEDESFAAAADAYASILQDYPESKQANEALVRLKSIGLHTEYGRLYYDLIQTDLETAAPEIELVDSHLAIFATCVDHLLTGRHESRYEAEAALDTLLVLVTDPIDIKCVSSAQLELATFPIPGQTSRALGMNMEHRLEERKRVDALLRFDGGAELATEETSVHTHSFKVVSCHPNPFNPVTTLILDVSQAGHVEIELFNMLGQRVQSVTSGFTEAGFQSYIVDGSQLATGMYVLGVQMDGHLETQKVMLLK